MKLQNCCTNENTLQSLRGKYMGLQGNPCNENRDPAMRTGVPCNENRFFPVGIGSQGVPCELYRVWVCSVKTNLKNNVIKHQTIFIFIFLILKIVFQRKCTGYLISEYCGAEFYLTALHCTAQTHI